MELLLNAKTNYLLSVSLDQLHLESQEWIKEVAFWKDEMSFFYKLLHSKLSSAAFPGEALAAMEKELVHINADVLTKMDEKLRDHERSLAAIVKSTSLQDEERYRENHKEIFMRMHDALRLIRSIKREVFSFVQKYEQ